MQIDHTVPDDLHHIADERDRYRRYLKDLLLARFNGFLVNIATMNACYALDHPPRSEKGNACACGKVKS